MLQKFNRYKAGLQATAVLQQVCCVMQAAQGLEPTPRVWTLQHSLTLLHPLLSRASPHCCPCTIVAHGKPSASRQPSFTQLARASRLLASVHPCSNNACWPQFTHALIMNTHSLTFPQACQPAGCQQPLYTAMQVQHLIHPASRLPASPLHSHATKLDHPLPIVCQQAHCKAMQAYCRTCSALSASRLPASTTTSSVKLGVDLTTFITSCWAASSSVSPYCST